MADHKKTVKSYLQKHKSGSSSTKDKELQNRNKHVALPPSSSRERDSTNHTAKPKVRVDANETRSSFLRKKLSMIKIQTAGGNIDNLPDEMLLKIFGYLAPNDLLSCARVCKRWLYLAKDNLLWEKIYKSYAPKGKTGSSAPATGSRISNGPSYWKSVCIKKCKESRDKKILPMLKKKSPFTGLCANTEKAIKTAGVRWLLCFQDYDGIDHVFDNSEAFYFNMSVCVRWYQLIMVPLLRIKKVKIYSGNPIFFDEKKGGASVPNSPCQRSLLFEMDFRWSEWKSKQPHGGDEMVDVHIVPGGLVVASFKYGKDIAFITANFHSNNLIQRCLMGSPTSVYSIPNHSAMLDDIDSKYGLHGYTCTIELRNQRTSFWNQQFRNLYTKEGDKSVTHARFILLDPENDYERSSVAKKISFLWKTDVFKGSIPDLCFMDLTLLDEQQKPMWCVSSAVNLQRPEIEGISYAFDGDHSFMEYSDAQGKIIMKFIWEHEEKQYFMVGLELLLSFSHINQWFGTKY